MGKKERTSISPRRRPMISSVSVDNAWVRHVNHTSSDIFTHVKDIFSLSKKKENFGGRQTDRERRKRLLRILNKKDLRGILIWSTPRTSRCFGDNRIWSTKLWGCAIIQLLVLCYGTSFNLVRTIFNFVNMFSSLVDHNRWLLCTWNCLYFVCIFHTLYDFIFYFF